MTDPTIPSKSASPRRCRRMLLVGGISGLCVTTILILVGLILWADGWLDYPNFSKVQIGDSKERVVDLMGKPRFESPTFFLGQKEGYEQKYAQAQASGAVIWFIYRGGLEVTFAIGFDSNGLVVYKASGGT